MSQPTKNRADNKAILILKLIKEKLQNGLSLFKRPPPPFSRSTTFEDDPSIRGAVGVPDDVEEGHFAVQTVNGSGEHERFVISLHHLKHPKFLQLLEKTEEVFGYGQEGLLSVPCLPGYLQRILDDGTTSETDDGDWVPRKTLMDDD